MSDTRAQLEQLHHNLGDFGDADFAPAPLGDVFNALLAEAKSDHPEDAVVAAIDPVKTTERSEFAEIDCRSLKALVDQLLTALRA
ncbi:MAG: hypothetical protein AB7T48_11610 [Solirubrobacterales bacterium]